MARGRLVQLYRQFMQNAPRGETVKLKEDFVFAYNQGAIGPYPDLHDIVGGVSWKTMERWDATLRKNNEDPLCLADRRGKHRKGKFSLTERQQEIITAIAFSPNQPLDSEIVRLAKVKMLAEGIEATQHPKTLCNFLNRLRRERLPDWIFYREGWKSHNETCLYHIKRDYDAIGVGDVIFADGHKLNFDVINPYTGKPKRMLLALWYDMKSNMPLGWDIMPSEGWQALTSALYRSLLRLGKMARVVYLDNGKANKSKHFTGVKDFRQAPFIGLFERLGMKSIFAWPYHPESKPIEGFFGIFAELERMAPSYTGTSIDKKPARLKRGERTHRELYEALTQGRVPTIYETHCAIASWVDEYASRPQRGHLKGRCPAEVFEEGRGPGFSPEEMAKMRLLMMNTEVKSIPRDGLTFPWSEERYYHPDLFGRQRQRALIRYDWLDRSSVYVYDLDGNFICEAMPMKAVHPAAAQLGTEEDKKELQEQIALKRRQEKQVMGPAREFCKNVILPEEKKRQESIGFVKGAEPGIAAKANPGGGKRALPDRPMTDEEKAKIEREYEAREAAHAVELAAEAEFRGEDAAPDFAPGGSIPVEQLPAMCDRDRYKALIALGVRGEPLPPSEASWMNYYEKGEEYRQHKDYYEDFAVRMVMMNQGA